MAESIVYVAVDASPIRDGHAPRISGRDWVRRHFRCRSVGELPAAPGDLALRSASSDGVAGCVEGCPGHGQAVGYGDGLEHHRRALGAGERTLGHGGLLVHTSSFLAP